MKKVHIKILLLTILSFSICLAYILTNKTTELFVFGSELFIFLNGLSLSFIAASTFYYLTIYIPEKIIKTRLRDNLEETFLTFKGECIDTFLSASKLNSQCVNTDTLLEVESFREFFNKPKERWYAVLNGLDDYHIKHLSLQFDLLIEEIRYFLNKVSVDSEIHDLLRQLKIFAIQLKKTSSSYDDVKSLSGFVWNLFAGWSYIEGYKNEDILKKIISKI